MLELETLTPFTQFKLNVNPITDGLRIQLGTDLPLPKDADVQLLKWDLPNLPIQLSLPHTDWANLVPHSSEYFPFVYYYTDIEISAEQVLQLFLNHQRLGFIMEEPMAYRDYRKKAKGLYRDLKSLLMEHQDSLTQLGYSVQEYIPGEINPSKLALPGAQSIPKTRDSKGFRHIGNNPFLVVAKTQPLGEFLDLETFLLVIRELQSHPACSEVLIGADFETRYQTLFKRPVHEVMWGIFNGEADIPTPEAYEAELLYLYLSGIPVPLWLASIHHF